MHLFTKIFVLFSDIFFPSNRGLGKQADRQTGWLDRQPARLLDCLTDGLSDSWNFRYQKLLLSFLAFTLLLLPSVEVWGYQPYYAGGVSMGANQCPSHRDRPSTEDIESICEEMQDDLEELADEINEGLESSLDEGFIQASGCLEGQVPDGEKSIDDLLNGKQACCKPEGSTSSIYKIFPILAQLLFPSVKAADNPTGSGSSPAANSPRCQRCMRALGRGNTSAIQSCNSFFKTRNSQDWPCAIRVRPLPVPPPQKERAQLPELPSTPRRGIAPLPKGTKARPVPRNLPSKPIQGGAGLPEGNRARSVPRNLPSKPIQGGARLPEGNRARSVPRNIPTKPIQGGGPLPQGTRARTVPRNIPAKPIQGGGPLPQGTRARTVPRNIPAKPIQGGGPLPQGTRARTVPRNLPAEPIQGGGPLPQGTRARTVPRNLPATPIRGGAELPKGTKARTVPRNLPATPITIQETVTLPEGTKARPVPRNLPATPIRGGAELPKGTKARTVPRNLPATPITIQETVTLPEGTKARPVPQPLPSQSDFQHIDRAPTIPRNRSSITVCPTAPSSPCRDETQLDVEVVNGQQCISMNVNKICEKLKAWGKFTDDRAGQRLVRRCKNKLKEYKRLKKDLNQCLDDHDDQVERERTAEREQRRGRRRGRRYRENPGEDGFYCHECHQQKFGKAFWGKMAISGVLDGLGMYFTHRAHRKASAFSRMISQPPPPTPGYGFPLTSGVLYGSMFSGAGFGCGAGHPGFGGMYGMGPHGMMNPYGFGGYALRLSWFWCTWSFWNAFWWWL